MNNHFFFFLITSQLIYTHCQITIMCREALSTFAILPLNIQVLGVLLSSLASHFLMELLQKRCVRKMSIRLLLSSMNVCC